MLRWITVEPAKPVSILNSVFSLLRLTLSAFLCLSTFLSPSYSSNIFFPWCLHLQPWVSVHSNCLSKSPISYSLFVGPLSRSRYLPASAGPWVLLSTCVSWTAYVWENTFLAHPDRNTFIPVIFSLKKPNKPTFGHDPLWPTCEGPMNLTAFWRQRCVAQLTPVQS